MKDKDQILPAPSFSKLAISTVCILLSLMIFTGCQSKEDVWVGTWTTSPQLVEPHNNPPEPGLTGNTLRQVFRVSIGGRRLRMKFSNAFSTDPVEMISVHIARSAGGSAIDPVTDQTLTFNGQENVTLEPGTSIFSDSFELQLEARTDVTVTIFFGVTSADVTGHPGSRTTSYILTGNTVSDVDMPESVKTDHWYIINGLDVMAAKSTAAVAVLGNSITDGRGSGTNKQNRWPDELARRLYENPKTEDVAVLNAGIGGNCVLRPCLGPAAVDRFQRDVLEQSSIRWLIILEGINDIGQIRDADQADEVANGLMAAYDQMINDAHAANILVYGATLMPFGDSFYDAPLHEKARQAVNEWIRTSGRFDAVIDLDKAMGDPANQLRLNPEGDTGDHLHPNETGHRMMAEAVDLSLFE